MMFLILMSVLAICVTSWEKCPFRSFVRFLTGQFVLLLSSKSSLNSMDTGPLLDDWFVSIFSYYMSYLFTLVTFWHRTVSNFNEVQFTCFFFSFVAYTFSGVSKNSLPNPRSGRFTSVFYFKSFLMLALIFRSLVHFGLIFVYTLR